MLFVPPFATCHNLQSITVSLERIQFIYKTIIVYRIDYGHMFTSSVNQTYERSLKAVTNIYAYVSSRQYVFRIEIETTTNTVVNHENNTKNVVNHENNTCNM